MADLVTHLCVGLLPCALFAPRWSVPVVVGTVLPDLTGRVPQMGLALLPYSPPNHLLWMLDVAHTPIAQTVLCVGLAQAVVQADRRRALVGLWIGVALHFALDILQNHHGNGYYLAFPFSVQRFELEWIGSEATVAWAPYILGVTLLVVLLRIGWFVQGRRRDG